MSDAVVNVSRSGFTSRIALPLNEGQKASNIIASLDGRYLAYLVWNEDGTQRGIAAWPIGEMNARLIARPTEGYRVSSMLLADDGAGLAYVQVDAAQPALDAADWRVDCVPPEGGDTMMLTERASFADIVPPTLLAWPTGGSVFLDAATPDGTSQGIFRVDPDTHQGEMVVTSSDRVVAGPALSPDGTRLAYLTLDQGYLPDGFDGFVPTNVLLIQDVLTGETRTMPPPAGQAVYGVRWYPDGTRLLLDLVSLGGEADPPGQSWVLAPLVQSAPWPQTVTGAERAHLFDYEPLGNGVIYTTLPPVGEPWRLYIVPEIGQQADPLLIPLDDIAQEFGAPMIIRVPLDAE
jgi:hypothetical protein